MQRPLHSGNPAQNHCGRSAADYYAWQKKNLFFEKYHPHTAETRQEITRIQREMDATKWWDGELTALFKRLYEDNEMGEISNKHF